MYNVSKIIFNMLNVASITSVATGKVWALLAEQGKVNFVTYAFNYDNSISKDNRTRITLIINCYGQTYDKALQMHDAVEAVLKANKIYMENLASGYVEDTREAAVRSTYDYRITI